MAAGHLTESITDDCLIKTQQVQKEIKRVKIMDEHWGFLKLFKAWQFFKVFSVVCNFQNMCLGNLFFFVPEQWFCHLQAISPLISSQFLALTSYGKDVKTNYIFEKPELEGTKVIIFILFYFSINTRVFITSNIFLGSTWLISHWSSSAITWQTVNLITLISNSE